MASLSQEDLNDWPVGRFSYERHRPEETLLYQVIEKHWPHFQEHLAHQGKQLPAYVIQEFEEYLKCGCLHTHLLVLDGVYTTDEAANLRFHTVKTPTQKQLDALLGRIIQRLIRILERDGWLVVDAQQPWLDLHDTSPLDNLNAASIRYTIALGPGKGNRTLTIHNPAFFRPDQPIKTLTSDQNGFSLNAAVACLCLAHQRDSLERLCRYVSRPAICRDRLTSRADAQVQYQLKHPFRDGTTHMVFSPLDFIGKLVALVPRPRHHLVRYHGVLAPNAKLRKYIVPATASTRPAAKRKTDHKQLKATTDPPQQDALIAPLTWAQRLKRVFDIDITICPRCGGRLRVIGWTIVSVRQ